jgi:hypothetical protein
MPPISPKTVYMRPQTPEEKRENKKQMIFILSVIGFEVLIFIIIGIIQSII